MLIPDSSDEFQRRIRRVELLDLPEDPKGGAHGPLGIVLVHRRDAEDPLDRVPDELLRGAAEPLDHPAHPVEVAVDPHTHILGIGAFRRGGEPDQVAEEHRDDPALFDRSSPAPSGAPHARQNRAPSGFS